MAMGAVQTALWKPEIPLNSREPDAEPFLKSVQSERTYKEIVDLGFEGGDVCHDMLHPESCAWLGRISRLIQDGDPETKFSAVMRLSGKYDEMIAEDQTACANYMSFVLRQGIILNEIVRGLRAMSASKTCYLLPKDGQWSMRSGKTSLGLVAVSYSYSSLLIRLAADKRAQKFILAQFPNLVDIQVKHYYALTVPADFKSRHSSDEDVELLTKLQAATSLLQLYRSWNGLRETFMSTLLHDAVAACAFPKLCNISMVVLRRCTSSFDLLSRLDVLKAVMGVLEGSDDKVGLIIGVELLSHMLDTDTSFCNLMHREGLLLSYLLALALAAPADKEVLDPVVAVLKRTHPKLKTEGLGSGLDIIARLKAVALKDRVARRKKLQYESSFGRDSSITSKKAPGAESGIFRSSWQDEDEGYVKQLQFRNQPRRKCSRTECENVEAAPMEFKMCSQCRFASYCSADCQKLAWKQGHKDECKRRSGPRVR